MRYMAHGGARLQVQNIAPLRKNGGGTSLLFPMLMAPK